MGREGVEEQVAWPHGVADARLGTGEPLADKVSEKRHDYWQNQEDTDTGRQKQGLNPILADAAAGDQLDDKEDYGKFQTQKDREDVGISNQCPADSQEVPFFLVAPQAFLDAQDKLGQERYSQVFAKDCPTQVKPVRGKCIDQGENKAGQRLL